MNKGDRPTQTTQPAAARSGRASSGNTAKVLGIVTAVLLFSVVIVILAVTLLSVRSNGDENRYVEGKKMQAVFLNGGQVYFGNIKNLNDKYLRMSNIYYLRVNQTVQPNGQSSSDQDISLVKLGCELHGPTDEMLINREQVVFWENLKTDGQVAKAVADYVKQNPNGQNCNQTNQSTSTGTNGTDATTNSSTNTTTTPATKK